MQLNAYILAADPAWIEASVLSYYDIVDRIVVSYDENGRGWTGTPIDVEQCLRRLRVIDKTGKFDYRPGHFARAEYFSDPMRNDTYQRQVALDQASDGAKWVLQFDTDEVVADAPLFLECLREADAAGFKAIEFPARWIYCDLPDGRYLETCSRFWRLSAGYPGPVAVCSDTELVVARQCKQPTYRVDFRSRNTDPHRAKWTPVHRVIGPSQGIFHYSMVRDESAWRRKVAAWSHAHDRNWTPEFKRWNWSRRHPYLAALMTPVMPKSNQRRLRITTIRSATKTITALKPQSNEQRI
jgi:hypothetical protein